MYKRQISYIDKNNILYSKQFRFRACHSTDPSNSPLARFVDTMKTKCHISRLATKIWRWFNETKLLGRTWIIVLQGKTPGDFYTILCF